MEDGLTYVCSTVYVELDVLIGNLCIQVYTDTQAHGPPAAVQDVHAGK